MCMLQVKFDSRLKFFNLDQFSISFVPKGYLTKEIKNHPKLNQNWPEIKFNLQHVQR